MLITKSWWDTVDAVAADIVGRLVQRHPALVKTMDAWIADDNMWLQRTAILHQLRFKDQTDEKRLFGYCLKHGSQKEFFIRKAIGWALREYSKTNPAAVKKFVKTAPLTNFSKKEAMKWVEREG
jgi:3-methyladenine DNA glycosylase AlkD